MRMSPVGGEPSLAFAWRIKSYLHIFDASSNSDDFSMIQLETRDSWHKNIKNRIQLHQSFNLTHKHMGACRDCVTCFDGVLTVSNKFTSFSRNPLSMRSGLKTWQNIQMPYLRSCVMIAFTNRYRSTKFRFIFIKRFNLNSWLPHLRLRLHSNLISASEPGSRWVVALKWNDISTQNVSSTFYDFLDVKRRCQLSDI